jgi:hypothetical protein
MSFITGGGSSGTGTGSKPTRHTVAGTANGINTTFTLPVAVSDPTTLMLQLNGVDIYPPGDYTLAGDNVTITMATPPLGADATTGRNADELIAYY